MIDQLGTLAAIRGVLEAAGITVSSDRLNITKNATAVIQLPELAFRELDFGWAHGSESRWPIDCVVTYEKTGKHVAKSAQLATAVLEAFRNSPDLNSAHDVCDVVPLSSPSPFYAVGADGQTVAHYVRTITLKITHYGVE